MYAIVKTGGKQYKVTKGLIFETELLDAEVNSTVELEVVLAADDNGNVVAGNDAANAKVSATVVEHGKGKKITILRYKAKKNEKKKIGHRQPYTKVEITKIAL